MSGFRGHPSGLYALFATEFWERYGFYSLAAILTLYMDEHLKFSQQLSGQVYGGYIAGVYFMPLIGGFLADRVLGYNRSVMIGAVLLLEAVLRGHYVRTLGGIAAILAVISAILLIVHLWLWVIAIILAALALFLMVQKLRELWS